MIGGYEPDTSTPIRFFQFNLDFAARKLKAMDTTAEATWAYCSGIERMQGAVQAKGKIYISRGDGKDSGDVFAWISMRGFPT
jgi:hypothetical protein